MTASPISVAAQRRTLTLGVAATAPVLLLVWLAVAWLFPPLSGMQEPIARLGLAVKCLAVAALLVLFVAIEAVSHERLVSPAIDPLSGNESRRLMINRQYLQNSVEQFLLFAAGLLGLAWYVGDGAAARAVVATTVTWILARWLFWAGYHVGPRFRGIGLAGMAQSLVVLAYVVWCVGDGLGGPAGAMALFLPVIAIEIWLAVILRPSI